MTTPSNFDSPEAQQSKNLIESPIPDWCNVGVLLRVVLVVNGVCAAGTAAQVTSLAQWFMHWSTLVITVEPVLIASILSGCLVRPFLFGLSNRFQIGIAVCIPMALTALFQLTMSGFIDLPAELVPRNTCFAGILCALLIYWDRLRNRAFSPALSEARLQALQARIRPHFLFNSLNAVLALIRTEPRRAETVLEDLADLFRVIMRDQRERVPLNDEISLCKQYLEIEKVRLGERLTVEWHIDSSVNDDMMAALVPRLLLQPLVENAVHHGIEPRAEPGVIHVLFRRNGHYAEIVIANPWLNESSATQSARGNQIALDNVRQRLTLIYDLEARLETQIVNNHFKLTLQLPIHRR